MVAYGDVTRWSATCSDVTALSFVFSDDEGVTARDFSASLCWSEVQWRDFGLGSGFVRMRDVVTCRIFFGSKSPLLLFIDF